MMLLLACARQVELHSSPTAGEKTDVEAYLIGPDDVLEIIVWQNPDLSREVVVPPDGQLSLPLLGTVPAAGYTVPQLTETIRQALSVYYKETPQVAVVLRQARNHAVYILGQVQNPGRYEVRAGTTFLQALALAQGLTDFAAANSIIIRRRVADGSEVGLKVRYWDVVSGQAKNIILRPGDTIIVP
jgi:polysaccharide export outer membrane protein